MDSLLLQYVILLVLMSVLSSMFSSKFRIVNKNFTMEIYSRNKANSQSSGYTPNESLYTITSPVSTPTSSQAPISQHTQLNADAPSLGVEGQVTPFRSSSSAHSKLAKPIEKTKDIAVVQEVIPKQETPLNRDPQLTPKKKPILKLAPKSIPIIPKEVPTRKIQFIRRKQTYSELRYDPKSQPQRFRYNRIRRTNPEGPLMLPDPNFRFDRENHTLFQFGMFEKNQYDYEEINYPIPFNKLYNDHSLHYISFGKRMSYIPQYVGIGAISESESKDGILLMTGASSNHFIISMSCLISLALGDTSASLLYVDYGLPPRYTSKLQAVFELIHNYHVRHKSKATLYYRAFDFSHFPSWVNINNPHDVGGYAWKVITCIDALNEWKAIAGWVDGGSMVEKGVRREIKATKMEGMYSPVSEYTIRILVYPKTIEFLEGTGIAHQVNIHKRMCSGGHFFMNYNNEIIRNNLFIPYYQCAFTKRCISPLGSSRNNHRQDQAVLTVLIHQMGLRLSANPSTVYIANIHMDNGYKHIKLHDLLERKKHAISRA